MKQIKLTQNQYALVDDEDFEELNKYKWQADKTKRGTYYATRRPYINKKYVTTRMHNQIMNAKEIDHRDGDGLNNQKYNLRKCTRLQNTWNAKPRKNSSSQYKGVSKVISKYKNKQYIYWEASIKYKDQRWRKNFKNEIEAAEAYDTKAKEFFGEFARLNFPEDKYE